MSVWIGINLTLVFKNDKIFAAYDVSCRRRSFKNMDNSFFKKQNNFFIVFFFHKCKLLLFYSKKYSILEKYLFVVFSK